MTSQIYVLNLTKKGLQILRFFREGLKFTSSGWGYFSIVRYFWGGGLKLFREVEIIREGFKLFLKGIRCFRKWFRFFRVVEIFREGFVRWDSFRSVEFFQVIESFFYGNWKFFLGGDEILSKWLNFFHVGRSRFSQGGWYSICRNWSFLKWEVLSSRELNSSRGVEVFSWCLIFF